MTIYAATTSVPIERSRQKIEELLTRFGATDIGVFTRFGVKVEVCFAIKGCYFRFTLPLPTMETREVKFLPSGSRRSPSQCEVVLHQLTRARWRALALTIKSFQVGIEAGLFSFDQIFMPYIVCGDNRTIYEGLLPVIEDNLKAGRALPGIAEMVSGRKQLECIPEKPAGSPAQQKDMKCNTTCS